MSNGLFRRAFYLARERFSERQAVVVFGIAVFLLTGVTVYWARHGGGASAGTSIAPHVAGGNPQGAIEQSYRLLAALRKVDWDEWRVPRELRHLPDKAIGEEEWMRSPNFSSFAFPSRREGASADVAFYTPLYARDNPTYLASDGIAFHPSGFYIVGWKRGEVTVVPVEAVRVRPYSNHEGYELLFPGQKEYAPNLLKIPTLEMPDGKPKTEAQRQFMAAIRAKNGSDSCPNPGP